MQGSGARAGDLIALFWKGGGPLPPPDREREKKGERAMKNEITYEQWERDFQENQDPPGGWRLCDYDEAEKKALIRWHLIKDFPEYARRYYGDTVD